MLLKTVTAKNDNEGLQMFRELQKRTTRIIKESTDTMRISDLRDSKVGEDALISYQKYYKDSSRLVEKHQMQGKQV